MPASTGFVVAHLASGAAGLQIGALEAVPGATIGPWKAGASIVVNSVGPDIESVKLQIARTAVPPLPQAPNPCANLRREFGELRRQMTDLGQALLGATSAAEIEAIELEINIVAVQMDALRSDFDGLGCSGILI